MTLNEVTLKRLRDAIFWEQASMVAMDKLYCEFIMKMLRFQTGEGATPTNEEFEAWRDSVAARIEFTRLRALI